ncbi:MAG: electron transfer flavoprotein subunit alpha/FixB family protein [Clostridia bacterium]|nr:electron transfer flavoprotein subunit alpha/FixB family protein [Clostridia bacterium]
MKRLNILLADTWEEAKGMSFPEEEDGSSSVLFCADGPLTACQEKILSSIKVLQEKGQYDLLVFSGSAADMFAVRTAARCGGSALTAAQIEHADDQAVTAQRGAFSYNLRAVFNMTKKPVCISMEPAKADMCGMPDSVLREDVRGTDAGIRCIGVETRGTENPLLDACVVLIAGRGIGSAEGFGRIERAAQALGGAAGATRPVASDGWADFQQVIGISGKQISPDVCLVFAASGTMPFMMGIEKSGTIIAVNRDADASIFKACDIGVVADWRDVLEKIEDRSLK